MGEGERRVAVDEALAQLAETLARKPSLGGRVAQAVMGLFGRKGALGEMSAREKEEEARRIVDAAFFRVHDGVRRGRRTSQTSRPSGETEGEGPVAPEAKPAEMEAVTDGHGEANVSENPNGSGSAVQGQAQTVETAPTDEARTPTDGEGDVRFRMGREELDAMPAVRVVADDRVERKADIKDVFRSFGDVRNAFDGRVVRFPTGMAGKVGKYAWPVVRKFKELYEQSRLLFSEEGNNWEGHKSHPDGTRYHHYINRLELDGEPYVIRFTIREEAAPRSGEVRNNAHAATVSSWTVYKANGEAPHHSRSKPGGRRFPVRR